MFYLTQSKTKSFVLVDSIPKTSPKKNVPHDSRSKINFSEKKVPFDSGSKQFVLGDSIPKTFSKKMIHMTQVAKEISPKKCSICLKK